ncbi:NAD(P)H-dependent flavin oxidoreductase [Hephaestia mangrovi]|uniref:NAD(P)H-dependent flavin oxidoreductase n=1 Tax=Hephaestia mangrovi TaxID=2873268 RepID=UPI001CA61860|nr:nitronate monooxygenase [Hephaestia mangrovi]MBY8829012.1 nitronate monooxygenase [Hephaestia mangrovi]
MAGGWPDARFIARVGVSLPIVQAPMAGAGGSALAIAAARGGALASLPCGMATPEMVRREVETVRAAGVGPVNLNFFCHAMPAAPDDHAWRTRLAPFYAEFDVGDAPPPPLRVPFDAAMGDLVVALRPEVVSFHFGLPTADLLDRVRASGAMVIGNATTVDEARYLAGRGVDAIIAQGWEAGGHAGAFLPADPAERMGLFALLPQIVDAVEVPVIAAGGIADARGIAAAMMLGAAAVQIGTAYLRAPESLVSSMHRAALASEAAEHGVFTNLFSGGLARGLRNRLVETLGPIDPAAPPYPYASTALAPLRRAAEAKGDAGFSPLWAGQAARLGHDEPAEHLTQRLGREALALLAA